MNNIKQATAVLNRRKMVYLLAILVTLIVVDGIVTIWLVANGAATEGNPLLKPIVGEAGFMVLKAIGALVVAVLLWLRYDRRAEITARFAVAGYGLIVGWNVSLLLLSHLA